MGGAAQVFLGELEFHRQGRFGHGAKQRVEGLAWLEVDRAVLDLEDHVGAELAVQRRELQVGLLVAVVGAAMVVNEGPPHQHAAMIGQGVGQHVGPFGVGTVVIMRAGLAFGIRP